MKKISAIISALVKTVAEKGAGAASAGFCYEPKMPKSLYRWLNLQMNNPIRFECSAISNRAHYTQNI